MYLRVSGTIHPDTSTYCTVVGLWVSRLGYIVLYPTWKYTPVPSTWHNDYQLTVPPKDKSCCVLYHVERTVYVGQIDGCVGGVKVSHRWRENGTIVRIVGTVQYPNMTRQQGTMTLKGTCHWVPILRRIPQRRSSLPCCSTSRHGIGTKINETMHRHVIRRQLLVIANTHE